MLEGGAEAGDGQRQQHAAVLADTGQEEVAGPGAEVDGKRIFTAKEILTIEKRPKSLVVLGAGAIGMCFTGNFALTMMLEPAMLAPVLSQPSLPLDAAHQVESPPEELAQIRQRLEAEDLTVLAYRFAGDRFCQAQRFAAYEQALGDRFDGRVLPDSAANPDQPPFAARHVTTPHSVVTTHLIDEAGQPTLQARDDILAFFTARLRPGAVQGSDST